MHTTIEFSIPVPCHEKWNNMTPNEQGRFCASCHKSVVDFTSMTDQELVFYFKNKSEQTCGRFRSDQLNKEMLLEQSKRLNWFKYFLQVIFPTLLFAGKAYSQGQVKSTKINEQIIPKEKERISMGAPVMIKGDTTFCVKPYEEKPRLEMVHRKFAATTPKLSKPIIHTELNANLNVKPVVISEPTLSNNNVQVESFRGEMLSGVVGGLSIRKSEVSLLQRTKRIVVDSLKLVFNKPTNTIRVYPNPVTRSESLNIEVATKYPGVYTLAIVDMNGINMHREQLSIQSKSERRQIKLSQSVIKGAYVLQLIGADGTIIAAQKIIVGE